MDVKIVVVGDAMIPARFIAGACDLLKDYRPDVVSLSWLGEEDKVGLQEERIKVEKGGPDAVSIPEGLMEAVPGAEMLLVHYCPVSRSVLDAAGPGLRILGTCRAGCEHLDVSAATERGIVVFNVRGRNAEAVSDFAIGLILAECRNIARSHLGIARGIWRKDFANSPHIPELRGKTVGLIGFGRVGQLVRRKLSGFDVRVLVYDPYVPDDIVEASGAKAVDLSTLMRDSDFVSIHARLTPENRGMIGARELSLMKPTAYLINTARAGLVDERALIDALQRGAIAGAGLDVFHYEPIPADHPLLKLDNVTLTSHLAGTTSEALTRSPILLVEDILKYLKGQKPEFIVNPEVVGGEWEARGS
ncbi:MAG: 2-hydroxyacid dehydrogenase [bacterium]